jgi:hypothetical protein
MNVAGPQRVLNCYKKRYDFRIRFMKEIKKVVEECDSACI